MNVLYELVISPLLTLLSFVLCIAIVFIGALAMDIVDKFRKPKR